VQQVQLRQTSVSVVDVLLARSLTSVYRSLLGFQDELLLSQVQTFNPRDPVIATKLGSGSTLEAAVLAPHGSYLCLSLLAYILIHRLQPQSIEKGIFHQSSLLEGDAIGGVGLRLFFKRNSVDVCLKSVFLINFYI
jgi:hypothetical protein